MHDPVAHRRQRGQSGGGREHALGERPDRVDVAVRVDARASAVAQVLQVPRRVVHAEPRVLERVVEIAHGAMKLREHAARLARFRAASRASRG